MRKLVKSYDSISIPDLIELRKQLSEANKKRHEFWEQLRFVRNQILRYKNYHKIQPEEFSQKIAYLKQKEREFIENEFEAEEGVLKPV